MSTYRVYVTGDNSDDVTVGSWFTLEADDDVDAANEAITAARDCGWTNTHTTRVVLVDFRGDRDDHSGSRRLDVLEQQAPHLIAPGIGDVARHRLEQLRAALRAENISYGELVELADLAEHIEPGDVELLEAAGVPEFPDPYDPTPEPERRPEPTTHGGETAHQLARRILNQDRKTRPAGAFEQDAEELARLVLVSDSLEELEQA